MRDNIPPSPKLPLVRIIKQRDWSTDRCPDCYSSMHRRKYIFFGLWDGCIQSKCSNYYKGKQ